jgi:WD40 repeat protein
MTPFPGPRVALAAFAAALVSAAAAPPDEPQLPPIDAANAAQVRPLREMQRDVWRIVRGPGEGRLSLLGWETPVEVYDATTFKPVRRIAGGLRLVHFAASAKADLVAWSENGTQVEVRDFRAAKSLTLEVGDHQPGVAFSPDGKQLATGGYGTEVKLWDAASGRLVRSFDVGPVKGGLTPVFSPDGTLLAVGHRNAETRVFEVVTGKLLRTLPRKMSQELEFSPDGRTLAVGYVDGTVALWDPVSGSLLRSAQAGVEEVYTLDWSRAGDVLVTAGRAGKIRLWGARDLGLLKELDSPEWVIQVRFSPDGTRLLSAGGTVEPSPDRKVVIWGAAP